MFMLQNALQLMAENETLQSAIQRTERDTIEVITFLKKEDSQKDKQVKTAWHVQWCFYASVKIWIVSLKFEQFLPSGGSRKV